MKIITIIFILLTSIVFSQNTGLYGKRTFIDVNASGHYRLIHTLLMQENMYQNENGTLTQKKDRFDHGFQLAIGRAVKKNTAISLEFGMSFSSIQGPAEVPFSYQYIDSWSGTLQQQNGLIYTTHEAIKTRTISIMPKIEFNSKSNLPVGLNHQIGIGYTRSSIVAKEYLNRINYTQTNNYNYNSFFTDAQYDALVDDYTNLEETYSGFAIMYAFNIRTPVSKSLMINYGIRYTLNFGGNMIRSFFDYQQKNFTSRHSYSRLANVINFNLGLTYAF